MYTYCKKYGNSILLREEREIKRVKNFPCDLYFSPKVSLNKETGYRTIFGEPLIKDTHYSIKEAKTEMEMVQYLSFYGAKNFAYQYIRDNYLKSKPIFSKDIYILNVDIETGRDELGYSPASEARCPIISISAHDINKDIYHVFGYHQDGYTPKSDNVIYYGCSSEGVMMMRFIYFIENNYPHILTGWNCGHYDFPYIINRIKRISNPEEEIWRKLSPFNAVYDRIEKDDFDNKVQTYEIMGISILDYMSLFKKFTYKTPENYKLDTIAHMVLKDRKLNYSEYENLQDLYNKNFEKFIDYNIKDTNIVGRLDKKLKLFDLVMSVAYKAGANYGDVLSPVNLWDVLIYNFLLDRNIVPPMMNKESIKIPYIGAYVKEPTPGVYKWVISCDLNSLYPHIQMGYNISPEKIIEEKDLPKELLMIRNNIGSVHDAIDSMLHKEVNLDDLKKYDVCLTPNGQFYKRDGDGVIPEILEGLYKERKAVKKGMLVNKQKMQDDKTIDLKDDIAAGDTLQKALKILMNSEYGALANIFFRYYDIRSAEAITSTGRLGILWVAKYVNIFMNQICKTENVDYIIASDTDSVVYDSSINVNGENILIGDYYERIKNLPDENGYKKIDGKDFTLSMSETFELENKRIKYITKHKVKKKMFKVECNGNYVIITEDHSIIVKRNSVLKDIKITDIIEGDEIISIGEGIFEDK